MDLNHSGNSCTPELPLIKYWISALISSLNEELSSSISLKEENAAEIRNKKSKHNSLKYLVYESWVESAKEGSVFLLMITTSSGPNDRLKLNKAGGKISHSQMSAAWLSILVCAEVILRLIPMACASSSTLTIKPWPAWPPLVSNKSCHKSRGFL